MEVSKQETREVKSFYDIYTKTKKNQEWNAIYQAREMADLLG